MNKKIIFLIGTMVSISVLSACSSNKFNVKESKDEKSIISVNSAKFKDGIFNGEGEGFNGKTSVLVEVKKGIIKRVDVLNSEDDENYLNEAKKIISTIIEKQSLNVDSISGATFSSKGIISAVKNALKNDR